MRYGFAVVLVPPAPPHLYKCDGAGGKFIEGENHAERMSMFWYNSGLKRQDDCMQTRRQDEVRRRCARRLCASGCIGTPNGSMFVASTMVIRCPNLTEFNNQETGMAEFIIPAIKER